MLDNYVLGVDVWEGDSARVDYVLLYQKGVRYAFVRLNDMSGGHHLDANFAIAWANVGKAGMARAPYFVYNPWVDGKTNFAWANAHMPVEAKAVAIDIEVKYAGITPLKYAQDVSEFVSLCKAKWNTIIYTGAWFKDHLAFWPSTCEYWLAQYPYTFWYEGQSTTWEQVHAYAKLLSFPPYSSRYFPGVTRFWQCSGDKLNLPGCQAEIDINIWNGLEEDVRKWFGEVYVPPAVPTRDECIDNLLKKNGYIWKA